MDNARCPLVTVIIPAFNGRRFIAAALRSVWKQSYRPIDVIAVDDGSTDDTAIVASTVPHVKVIRKPHEGMAAACNTGIEAARSEFIAFLSQDYLWLPSKLRTQVDALLNEPQLGFVHCGEYPPAEPLDTEIEGSSDVRCNLSRCDVSGLVVRKSTFQQIGLFNTNSSPASDADWFLRATSAHIPMKFLPEALFERQIIEDSSHEQPPHGEAGEIAEPTAALQ